ncbi:tRNA pseudouridine(38-40) synthase TruA [Rubellicoccus peritrichatus]|uniref:tRNA pseudouridine synthase A n=1 Tax=Rubellicoccus peritrichatus TaxID=3080537 RepID=A0AAQ3LAY2_9BACT|nr:tRNA pseudouridine(38-40) synthase TruA [Puniceicoccus sp. CR14]WOO41214.1 tRNA pseudouridine(38-40) synthase TruA [Puniceicoccus sp. CR14]
MSDKAKRWRAVCAYDGSELHGWQSQPGGNTVQDFIEARLGEIFSQPVRIHGSGRTDAGVHAKAQVFHFDGVWKHPPEHLGRALKCGIPASIQIVRVDRAKPDFHARFSATGKRYVYRIYHGDAPPWESRYCWSMGRRRLDIEAMNDAARRLLGKHDFTAFGANRGDGSTDNPVKDMRRLEISKRGSHLTLTTEASGYLYKMVRSLTGSLVEVGLGKLSPDELEAIFKSRQRPYRIQTAPANGLWLEKVFYDAR